MRIRPFTCASFCVQVERHVLQSLLCKTRLFLQCGLPVAGNIGCLLFQSMKMSSGKISFRNVRIRPFICASFCVQVERHVLQPLLCKIRLFLQCSLPVAGNIGCLLFQSMKMSSGKDFLQKYENSTVHMCKFLCSR